jgi:hypothetical protein
MKTKYIDLIFLVFSVGIISTFVLSQWADNVDGITVAATPVWCSHQNCFKP